MTQESNAQREKEKESRTSTLKLIIAVAAAFIAALMFRKSVGILAMTPAAFSVCALSTLIGLKPLIKNSVFALTVFIVNTIEHDDVIFAVVYSALCLLVCIVSDVAVAAFKKSKKRGVVISAAGSILCIVLSIIFVGNPFTAWAASNTINEYTESKYPSSEDAALGRFEFSDIYYNFKTGSYGVDAVSTKFPTEGAVITASGDGVRDGFKARMLENIAEPYVLEITSVLRESFPDDSFSVSYDNIVSMPGEAVLSKADGALYGYIVFEITLGGIQTAPAMISQVEKYAKAIDSAGIEYAELVFKSGTGQWMRRSVSVSGNRFKMAWTPTLDYVPAGSPNDFSKYFFPDVPQ